MSSYLTDDEISARSYDHRLMKRLLAYVRPYKAMFALAFVLSIGVTVAMVLGPFIVRDFIESVRAESKEGPGLIAQAAATASGGHYTHNPAQPWELIGTNPAGMVIWFALLLIAAEVFVFFARYYQQFSIQVLGQRVLHDLRMHLFTHLQSLPLAFFQKQPVGRLVTRLSNDVNALAELFSAALIPVFTNLLIVVGVGVALLMVSLKLGTISLLVLPIIVLVTYVFQLWVRGHYRNSRKLLSRINAFLAEQCNGMREVQLFNREAHNLRQFDDINQEHYEALRKTLIVIGFYRPAVSILYSVSIGMVLWFGLGETMRQQVSMGDLILFTQLLQHFFQPIQQLADQYNVIQSAMASAERIFTLMDIENTMPDPAAPRDAELAAAGVTGRVLFDDIHFRYRPEEPILRGITVRAEPGEHIALVGHTGAGKSTCINLLGRFYDVEAGRVLLDGFDVRELSAGFLRKHVAVVHQDVFCFAGTLAQNIDLGSETVSRERVAECARAVNAHTFIERLPDGYDTEVTEGGKTFSLGERQLLAFARALAADPKILVLDEATANIDTRTEALIQDALQRLIAGRTAIIIAHRLSTIRSCDRIYVLDHGRVVEEGSHDELLAANGYYAELYQQQFAESSADAEEPAAESAADLATDPA
ncbi:MAG: ABC transporter ATP-binding protein [Planctomycetota bacterium]